MRRSLAVPALRTLAALAVSATLLGVARTNSAEMGPPRQDEATAPLNNGSVASVGLGYTTAELVVTPIVTETEKITATDGKAYDEFTCLAIDGDLALASASASSDQGWHSGKAYILRLTDGKWGQEPIPLPKEVEGGDLFGAAGAIGGGSAFIYAEDDGPAGIDQGAVYHYALNGGLWEQQPTIYPTDGFERDHFGQSLATDGAWLAVGSPGDDDAGTDHGSVYVYQNTGEFWLFRQKIVPTGLGLLERFGYYTSIGGARLLVGSIGAGRAFVYHLNTVSGQYEMEDELVSEDGGPLNGPVALDGNTALVGVLERNAPGAVYVFKRTGSTWWQEDKLRASDGQEYDGFGASLAIDGTIAVIGGHNKSLNGAYRGGQAYIFERQDEASAFAESTRLQASDLQSFDFFSRSVVIENGLTLLGSSSDEKGDGAGAIYYFAPEVVKPECYRLSTGAPHGGRTYVKTAPNCPLGYTAGTTVQVEALHDTDYSFVQWTGDLQGTTQLRNLVMESDKFIEPHFALPDQRPAVVLVHGFKAFWEYDEPRIGCATLDIDRCASGTGTQSDPFIPSYASYPCESNWQDLGTELEVDRDVYAASIDTWYGGTPSLESNANCLRQQVSRLADYSDVVLIAHSMGGLVARAYLEETSRPPLSTVSGVVTMGTPHTGTASQWWCERGDEAACQFSLERIGDFNRQYSMRRGGVDYSLIGGNICRGVKEGACLLAHQPLQVFADLGPSDGAVGAASATGYQHRRMLPDLEVVSSAPTLGGKSMLSRHVFPEAHYGIRGIPPSYFDSGGETYNCVMDLLGVAGDTSRTECFLDWVDGHLDGMPMPTAAVADSEAVAVAEPEGDPVSTTTLYRATLAPGEAVVHRVTLDTVDSSVVLATWITGTMAMTLTSPTGLVIDPDYASAYADDVTYIERPPGSASPLLAGYQFTNTVAGDYTATLHAAPDNPDATEYELWGVVSSPRTLEVATDRSDYPIGVTATIKVSVTNGIAGLAGATVVADIGRMGVVTDTLVLQDQGDGTYVGDYVVPDAPGYLGLAVTAQGEEAGEAYSRIAETMFAVMSPSVALRGAYDDAAVDNDADGRFDSLDVTVGVTCTQAGQYTLSGDLVDTGGEVVAHAVLSSTLAAGVVTATVPFDGDQIRGSGVDGPYTLTNLSITDHQNMMVPTVWSEADLWQTAPYTWESFASSCFLLDTEVDGQGTIAVSPARDCNDELQYTLGSTVAVTATAGANFAFWEWTGDLTGADVAGSVAVTRDREVGARFVARADCNGDRVVDAGDISATILRIFGNFVGTPGCDANADAGVDAGDISCTVLTIFGGAGACRGG